MPKNTRKQKNAKNKQVETARELILKSEEQEYAKVVKMLGGPNVECECFDNKTRMGIIRKTLKRKKRNRMEPGSIILLTLRDFEDGKADIIHVYNAVEVARLIKLYEIPDTAIDKIKEEDTGIAFDEEEEEDDTEIDILNI